MDELQRLKAENRQLKVALLRNGEVWPCSCKRDSKYPGQITCTQCRPETQAEQRFRFR